MLIVETIAKIQRYHFVEGRNIKHILRDLQISKNMVRKVIHSDKTEFCYERETQHFPNIGDFTGRLDELLEEDVERPKHRRMTAQRMYELLQWEKATRAK